MDQTEIYLEIASSFFFVKEKNQLYLFNEKGKKLFTYNNLSLAQINSVIANNVEHGYIAPIVEHPKNCNKIKITSGRKLFVLGTEKHPATEKELAKFLAVFLEAKSNNKSIICSGPIKVYNLD